MENGEEEKQRSIIPTSLHSSTGVREHESVAEPFTSRALVQEPVAGPSNIRELVSGSFGLRSPQTFDYPGNQLAEYPDGIVLEEDEGDTHQRRDSWFHQLLDLFGKYLRK